MLWATVELRARSATDKDPSGTRKMGTSGLAREVKGSLTMRAFTETESANAMMSRPFATIFGIVRRRRTYSRMFYLFASFPLGLLYFITVVVGLSVGAGLAVIGVGLLLLLATGALWRAFAAFERQLVMWWIGVEIPPPVAPQSAERGLWPRIWAEVRSATTWKSLVYVLVEFPFGIFAFSVALALVTVSLGLLLAPLMYLFNTALYNTFGGLSTFTILFNIQVDGTIHPLVLALTLAATAAGVCASVASLWLLNGLAVGWGELARVLLGRSAAEQRLAEARAIEARAQATEQRVEQGRRELIVNVSHELRTPIASIRGHVESLLMPEGERPPETEQEAYLRIIARESERLSALVDDLAVVARAEADELRLELRPTQVGDVIEEVYAALAPLARRERQVTLVRRVAPDLPPIWADRGRLTQVLLNLARNGIAYTPAGGIVSLTAERDGEVWVQIAVADTGIGIAPEELPRVFERFYRTDASRSRASGGFGLGLAIARDLVQAMGGTLSVESTPGAGSTFRTALRVATGTPPTPAE